jgi:uncharacterized protein (TIGR00299 family) protein
MSTILFVDPFSGASGDMLLGALLDLGLPRDGLQAELGKMALSGYEIDVERRVRRGLAGTAFCVRDVARENPARHLHDVRHLVQESTLSLRVQEAALAVFERLARVEARIHGVSPDQIHFHEIGAVDSLVDVVGFVAGLELLGVERVFCSELPLGSGTIEVAHGVVPVPAPATLALLAEVGAPTRPHPAQTEIVTPTGAALLAELASFGRPAMRVRAVGYGFGQKEFSWANVVRAWLGETDGPVGEEREEVALVACNLDDATGELLGYAMERLLAAGALDVWFTPVQMKKNRPAVVLTALAPPERVDGIVQVTLRETPTLGVRVSYASRFVAERRAREVETAWGRVGIKEKWLDGTCAALSPEYEDCARLAREHGVPLQDVIQAAHDAALQTGALNPTPTAN